MSGKPREWPPEVVEQVQLQYRRGLGYLRIIRLGNVLGFDPWPASPGVVKRMVAGIDRGGLGEASGTFYHGPDYGSCTMHGRKRCPNRVCRTKHYTP